jgi:hypothetical protein
LRPSPAPGRPSGSTVRGAGSDGWRCRTRPLAITRAQVYRGWSADPAPALRWRGINCRCNPDADLAPPAMPRRLLPASGARPLVEPIRRSGVPQGVFGGLFCAHASRTTAAPRALAARFEDCGLPWGRVPLLVEAALPWQRGTDPVASQDQSGEGSFRGLATLAAGDRLA